jgi:hypothetical protein
MALRHTPVRHASDAADLDTLFQNAYSVMDTKNAEKDHLSRVIHQGRLAQKKGDAMGKNKVVARFRNGSILKGNTSDFLPNKNQFHLETENGDILTVDVDQLKAIFFVKDFTGNKDHVESYADQISGCGRKIRVKFSDGELIVGYTTGYSPDRQGFYITPAEAKSNNERIFVVKSASEKIEFL